MKKIGIVGGGQLGSMMIDEIHNLGYEAIVLEQNPKCPCALNADELINAPYDDYEALEMLCKKSDCITYEFENVPSGAMALLEETYSIPQGSNALYLSQNRLREKKFAQSVGFTCPKFVGVKNKKDLLDGIKKIGLPCILKTTEGGYDGHGQYLINSLEDINFEIDQEFILEEKIDFDYEISCIACRSLNGQIVVYPLFKNEHLDGILHYSRFLNDDKKQNMVSEIMRKFIADLKYSGTLCVELFVKGDEILFNEMAPRPHNSGHLTIEACKASQFKNHILGILGLDIIEPEVIHDCQMINILGRDVDKIPEMLKEPIKIGVHMYGKDSIKPKRKMGHITLIDNDINQVNEFLKKYF